MANTLSLHDALPICSLGALLAPPETAWAEAYYGAERAWGGRGHTTREDFTRRFAARFYGVDDRETQDRLWAVSDLALRDHQREAREVIRQVHPACRRNQATLAFLDSWCALGAFHHYVERFEEAVMANYRSLRAGEADAFQAGRLRWRIEDLKTKLPEVVQSFRERAMRVSPASSAEECLSNRLAYDLARLEELAVILAPYPLPSREWQQPVRV
jgi:hypothetical protein